MIGCRDSCGAEVEDERAAQAAGWGYLDISKGWRCGSCARLLREAATRRGTSGQTADTLPPSSIGALPRETASTITAPARIG